MELWTQYQILVQFCFQGMSAWHSVALILAAEQTELCFGMAFPPSPKPKLFPQCQFSALVLSETWLCSSLAKGLCHGSSLPWLLPATAAASSLGCTPRTKGGEKAEGVWCQLVPLTALLGCSTRAGGQRPLLESSRSAVHTPPEQIQKGFRCTGRGESLNSHSELHSGKREKEWKVDAPLFAVLLFPEFKLMGVAGYICEYKKWVKPETGSWMS